MVDYCCYVDLAPAWGYHANAPVYTSYAGTFDILGGADSNASNVVGTGTFQANVVPEPASLLLLGSGLGGVIRRKRQK